MALEGIEKRKNDNNNIFSILNHLKIQPYIDAIDLNTLKQAGLLVTKGKPPTTRYYIKRGEYIGELKNISR